MICTKTAPISKSKNSLKFLSLNLAHGIKGARGKKLKHPYKVEENLKEIVRVLVRENPDVVALQETEFLSNKSRILNQLEFIARHAGYPHRVTGAHVTRNRLSYGTALLSRFPLSDCFSHTFAPSFPTPLKGFSVGTISHSENDQNFDVVSLHLDFARKSVRHKQILSLSKIMQKRKKPLIIMGDFNCEWSRREKTLPTVLESLNLQAFDPLSSSLKTFKLLNRRLDWILISSGFSFSAYKILEDQLSDHFGILSEIQLD